MWKILIKKEKIIVSVGFISALLGIGCLLLTLLYSRGFTSYILYAIAFSLLLIAISLFALNHYANKQLAYSVVQTLKKYTNDKDSQIFLLLSCKSQLNVTMVSCNFDDLHDSQKCKLTGNWGKCVRNDVKARFLEWQNVSIDKLILNYDITSEALDTYCKNVFKINDQKSLKQQNKAQYCSVYEQANQFNLQSSSIKQASQLIKDIKEIVKESNVNFIVQDLDTIVRFFILSCITGNSYYKHKSGKICLNLSKFNKPNQNYGGIDTTTLIKDYIKNHSQAKEYCKALIKSMQPTSNSSTASISHIFENNS